MLGPSDFDFPYKFQNPRHLVSVTVFCFDEKTRSFPRAKVRKPNCSKAKKMRLSWTIDQSQKVILMGRLLFQSNSLTVVTVTTDMIHNVFISMATTW